MKQVHIHLDSRLSLNLVEPTLCDFLYNEERRGDGAAVANDGFLSQNICI